MQYTFRKVLVSILLVSVLIPLLASAESASSQTFETRTTLLTSTSFGVTALTTSYRTSTATLEAQNGLSQMVIVGPVPKGSGCNFIRLTYTVKDPGYVFGHFNASSAIRFYFLTDESLLKWIPIGYAGPISCTIPRSDTLVSVEDALSYSFEVYVSTAGLYDFVFLNLSPTQSVAVNFSANTGQTTTTTTTFAMVSYSTVTQPFVLTSTQTLGSISPQATQSSIFVLGQNGLLIYASLGSIAVIASVLVLRRRKKRVVTTSIVEPKAQAEARTSETPSPMPSFEASLSTGYGELDSMLGGGIPEGYAIVVVSPSFDERDLLIRRTIASSIASGRPTFYLSNEIAKTRDLISKFGLNFYALNPLADKIATDRDNLFKIPDVGDLSSLNISSNLIMESKAKTSSGKVIVIDLLSDVLLRNKAPTTRRWLTDFTARRKASGFTILATLDPSTASKEEIQMIIGPFDGVIEVYEKPLLERSRRFLVIKKMYGRDYSENELMLDKQKLL